MEENLCVYNDTFLKSVRPDFVALKARSKLVSQNIKPEHLYFQLRTWKLILFKKKKKKTFLEFKYVPTMCLSRDVYHILQTAERVAHFVWKVVMVHVNKPLLK